MARSFVSSDVGGSAVVPLPGVERVGLSREDFETLAARARPRIWRMLRALGADADAADELTQECLLRAYRARGSFRGASSGETWLITIAINLARDRGRSRRWAFWRGLVRPGSSEEATLPDPPAEDPSPERRLLAREACDRVWDVLAGLSPQQREVFALRFVEEMSLDEIAARLDLAPGTVKVHLSRATRALRERALPALPRDCR